MRHKTHVQMFPVLWGDSEGTNCIKPEVLHESCKGGVHVKDKWEEVLLTRKNCMDLGDC